MELSTKWVFSKLKDSFKMSQSYVVYRKLHQIAIAIKTNYIFPKTSYLAILIITPIMLAYAIVCPS